MIDQQSRRRWTRSELIRAFNLYCQIPFGRIHNRNPAIITLAISLDRSPSAVSWKLANFARLDPTLAKRNIKGASHGSKEEELIWREFESDWENLAFESERLRLGEDGLASIAIMEEFPEGRSRESLVKVRVNIYLPNQPRRRMMESSDCRMGWCPCSTC
jgi:putative restriction endonuclease